MDISVVIPAYNSEKTIEETLNAVLDQDFDGPYEVIVVDDGSSDKTVEIAKEKSVNLITQEKSGPAKARNNGWKTSKGSTIVFTDSDCVPVKQWLKTITKPFSDPTVGGVGGEYQTKNPEKIIARFIGEEIAYRHSKMGRYINAVGTYSTAFRKAALEEVGGFDESFKMASGEDTDISFKIIKAGYKLVYEPEAIVMHPHRSDFFGYMREQFFRAAWRYPLYKKHKGMLKGDSYSGFGTLVQFPLTGIFLASIPLGFINNDLNLLYYISGFILILTFLPFFLFELKRDIFLACAGLLIQSGRVFVWFGGVMYGFIFLRGR